PGPRPAGGRRVRRGLRAGQPLWRSFHRPLGRGPVLAGIRIGVRGRGHRRPALGGVDSRCVRDPGAVVAQHAPVPGHECRQQRGCPVGGRLAGPPRNPASARDGGLRGLDEDRRGGGVLWYNGMAPGGLFGAQVLWALGDFLGIASVAPALMIGAARWQRGQLHGGRPQLLGERTLWNMAMLASFLVMAWGMRASTQFALGLTALPLAVMMWSAVSFTPLRTSVSALLTVAVVAALASQAVSGFPQPHSVLETAILIGYLCLLAMLPQGLALSIDEHRWLNRRLERRATTDALSGLPNRAAFELAAQAALEDPGNQP